MYGLIEIFWRGDTHISMFLVGGLCFFIIGNLDEHGYKPCLIVQASLSCAVITAAELFSGIIVNMLLGLDVWDYSMLPYNVLGQICLPFSVLWLMLSVPAIYLEDALRLLLFGEPMKSFSIFPALIKKRPANTAR